MLEIERKNSDEETNNSNGFNTEQRDKKNSRKNRVQKESIS